MEEHRAEYDREEIPRPGLSFSLPSSWRNQFPVACVLLNQVRLLRAQHHHHSPLLHPEDTPLVVRMDIVPFHLEVKKETPNFTNYHSTYFSSRAGTSLAVQWLRLCLPTQGDASSGSQDPTRLKAKKPEHKQKKRYCNKFSKDFKNGPQEKKKNS